MPLEFSVLLRSPSPLKCTKRHAKLRRTTTTTSMTRWSLPLHWKLDARLSIPKTSAMARRSMGNSRFEIPSLDPPASGRYNFKSRDVYGRKIERLITRRGRVHAKNKSRQDAPIGSEILRERSTTGLKPILIGSERWHDQTLELWVEADFPPA